MDNVTRHQLVRPIYTFTVQAANCGGDLRVAMSLCPYKVHMSRETLVCVIVVLVYNIYLILIIYGYRYQ